MKERPMIFSAPMVRAILEGQKTQTRRVVKRRSDGERPLDFYDGMFWFADGEAFEIACPFGVVGDQIWVRETFGIADGSGRLLDPCVNYRADGSQRPLEDRLDLGWGITGNQYGGTSENLLSIKDGWRSPIHMPRWASRITLEITDVRVQRVQEISEDDAIAEGIRRETLPNSPDAEWPPGAYGYISGIHAKDTGPIWSHATQSYKELWDSINGEKAPWASNSWVWAISFKRVDQ